MVDINAPDAAYVIKLGAELIMICALFQHIPQDLNRAKQQLLAGVVVHQSRAQPVHSICTQRPIAILH